LARCEFQGVQVLGEQGQGASIEVAKCGTQKLGDQAIEEGSGQAHGTNVTELL
jgi:hypothetical protein